MGNHRKYSVNFYTDNLIQPCIEAAVEEDKSITLNFIKKDNSNDFIRQTKIAKKYIDNVNIQIDMCAYVDTYEDAILATTTACNEISLKTDKLSSDEIKDIIKVYHALNRKVQVECESEEAVNLYKESGADSVLVDCTMVEATSKLISTTTKLKSETIEEAKKYFDLGANTIILSDSLNVEATKTMRAQREVNAFSIKVIEEYFRGYKEQIKSFLKEAE